MKINFMRFAKLFFLFAILASIILSKTAFPVQIAKQKGTSAEELLAQADLFFQKGEYNKAIESYLEVSKFSEKKNNLSRAYFGLSLSYFYLKDTTNTKKWIIKVLEVDPNKYVSSLFYPESFVKIFYEIQKEINKEKEKEESKEISLSQKALEGKKEKEEKEGKKEELELAPKKREKRWELEVHFSSWSVDLIKGLFEADLNREAGEEIRNELFDQIASSHPGLRKTNHEQKISFDSGGSNYGFEARFYPGGERGFFSLGFSLEKTKIRLSLEGPAKQEFSDGSYAQINATGYIETNPLTTNFSFRWDFKPSWRVTPYFVFGVGLASLKGELGYVYSGTYRWAGFEESLENSKTKTFVEFNEESDTDIPNFFLLIQSAFGVRGEIHQGICLKAEAGFWNGFLLRFGLAYRF